MGEGHNCVLFCFQIVLSWKKIIDQLSSGIDFGGFSRGRLGKGFVFLEELNILDEKANFATYSIYRELQKI